MKFTPLILLFALLSQLNSTAQTTTNNNNLSEGEQSFIFLILSADDQIRRAQAQKDIIMSEPELLKAYNIYPYHVLPDRIIPILNRTDEKTNRFGNFQELIERGTVFKIILMNGRGKTLYRGENPISFTEIVQLITENGAKDNPQRIKLDTIQSR